MPGGSIIPGNRLYNNMAADCHSQAFSGQFVYHTPYTFSSVLISNFFIFIKASITFCALSGFDSSFGNTVGTTCQGTPYLSFSQPQLLSLPPSAVSFSQ